MIDIHDAHHAATTWREFFIHIATIVLGLLIAIGLEQTVEYVHHRHLAQEAREQLRKERAKDETSNEVNIFTTRRHVQDLLRDLAILHAVETHAPAAPGPFILRRYRYVYPEDTWRKLHQSGTINYLTEDLGAADYRYFNQEAASARIAESTETLSHASSVLLKQSHASPASFELGIAIDNFERALVASHFTLNERAVEQGYAPIAEHADLSQLTPKEIDELEGAITVALADDDAVLTYCFNIERDLKNHPGQ